MAALFLKQNLLGGMAFAIGGAICRFVLDTYKKKMQQQEHCDPKFVPVVETDAKPKTEDDECCKLEDEAARQHGRFINAFHRHMFGGKTQMSYAFNRQSKRLVISDPVDFVTKRYISANKAVGGLTYTKVQRMHSVICCDMVRAYFTASARKLMPRVAVCSLDPETIDTIKLFVISARNRNLVPMQDLLAATVRFDSATGDLMIERLPPLSTSSSQTASTIGDSNQVAWMGIRVSMVDATFSICYKMKMAGSECNRLFSALI